MCGCGCCGSFLYRCARALDANNPDDVGCGADSDSDCDSDCGCCLRRRQQRRHTAALQRYTQQAQLKLSHSQWRLIAVSFCTVCRSLACSLLAALTLSHTCRLALALALALGVCERACACNCKIVNVVVASWRGVAWRGAARRGVSHCFLTVVCL